MSNKLPKIFELYGYSKVENVLVIGCGGTGAYVISHLTRLISVLNSTRDDVSKIQLYVADGDFVEEKNLARQHFISADLNKNKASVLAERYSNAFGLEIGVLPKDVENLKDLSFLYETRRNKYFADLIVGCVDNNASRALVNSWFATSDYYLRNRARFWIDCGNEEKNGQVVCGYAPSYNGVGTRINPKIEEKYLRGEFSTPSVAELYPEILQGESKFNSSLSCAERAISAPQNIQTNITAATTALNYIQKTLLGESIKSCCVEFSIDNAFSTKLNTAPVLDAVKTERKRYWENVQ